MLERELGEAIREIRTQRGWRQRDVVERIGMSPARWSQIEAGRVRPRLKTLDRMFRALGVEPRVVEERMVWLWIARHGFPRDPSDPTSDVAVQAVESVLDLVTSWSGQETAPRGEVFLTWSRVLKRRGRTDEALAILSDVIYEAQRKRNMAMVAEARLEYLEVLVESGRLEEAERRWKFDAESLEGSEEFDGRVEALLRKLESRAKAGSDEPADGEGMRRCSEAATV